MTSVAGRGTIVLGNDRDLQLAPDEETKARLAGLRMVRTITPLPAKLVGLSADRGGSRPPAVGNSPTPVGMLTILDTNLAAKGAGQKCTRNQLFGRAASAAPRPRRPGVVELVLLGGRSRWLDPDPG